eukprot:SAG11_NODE_12820_length_683_cov_1.236301_1_plen_113_part_00
MGSYGRPLALVGAAAIGCTVVAGSGTVWWLRQWRSTKRLDLTSTYRWTDVNDLLDVGCGIVESAQAAFLITVDGVGQPRARVVDPLCGEQLKRVWIATVTSTRKASGRAQLA